MFYLSSCLTLKKKFLCSADPYFVWIVKYGYYFPTQPYPIFFITETECVYCAVRTKYLYVTHIYFIQVNFTLLTVVSEYCSFFLSVLLYRCTYLILIYALPFVAGLMGEAGESAKYPCCYGNLGALDRSALSLP